MTQVVTDLRVGGPRVVVGLCVVVYLPFTLLGFGTDIDVANVVRAGRSWVEHGDYQMSRGPGAPVHEIAVGYLDRAGGSVLVNLASVAFAAMALLGIFLLVRRDGSRLAAWAVLVLASNPWFWIAATSLGDFAWALGLVLAGAACAQDDRPIVAGPQANTNVAAPTWRGSHAGRRIGAGLLFGLAIGCRASSVLLVLAWLLAELTGSRSSQARRRDVAVTAGTALVVGIVCFIPPWLDSGRSLAFIRNELDFVGFGPHLGRWAVKNLAVVGLIPGVVLLAGIRRALGALGRWEVSTVVRFAVLVMVLTELLFFRLPFKPLHLLPMVAGTALLVGASPLVTRRWVVALVAAQLAGGMVGVTIAEPDVPNAARHGRLDVSITAGPLLTDVRCRLDDRDLGPWPDPASDAATQRAAANSDCQSSTWRAG